MSFKILGTGMCVPEKIVTNDDLSNIVETNDEWITTRVGIKRRHIATTETTADLAISAAKNALENSGTDASEIDLILVSTISGDYVCPSVACCVQAALGIDCIAYDISAACSAFVYLLETAAGYFARKAVKKVLVIAAERLSRLTDWADRSTCVIFADGAGAAVLGEGDGYLGSVFHVQGGSDVIKIPVGQGKSPFAAKNEELDVEPYIIMHGQDTFKYAVSSMSRDIREVLEKSGVKEDELKCIIPHQANKRIIEAAARRSGIEQSKFYMNIEDYGNTSSASIPIALDQINRTGMLSDGDLILLTAFGGGLSSAACVIRW